MINIRCKYRHFILDRCWTMVVKLGGFWWDWIWIELGIWWNWLIVLGSRLLCSLYWKGFLEFSFGDQKCRFWDIVIPAFVQFFCWKITFKVVYFEKYILMKKYILRNSILAIFMLKNHLQGGHKSLDGLSCHVRLHRLDARVQGVRQDQKHRHPGKIKIEKKKRAEKS